MANFRFKALESVLTRAVPDVKTSNLKISDFFSANVFDKRKMKEFLSSEAFGRNY